MPVSSVTEHWIKQDAITINLNHFGDPDYLQVSVLAGAVVMAFKQDVIGYNAAHNYRTWPLQAANTCLESTSAVNVYARLTRSEVNASALIIYDSVLRDIEGRAITYAENGSEILGNADTNYFYVFLGQISGSIDNNGEKIERNWEVSFRFGNLDTSQYRNEEAGGEWMKMFRLNKVTDMIEVLKTFSSAVFKKLFIGDKEIGNIHRSVDNLEIKDDVIPTTKYTEESYLSKKKNDHTPHSLSVGKEIHAGEVVSSDKAFEVGDFAEGTLGSGGSIFMRDGNSFGEVDFLKVRKKATFSEITVQELKHVGGEIILSSAAMICSEIEELTNGWKCYFNNKDSEGREIYNEFEAGDQARCQTFNLTKRVDGMLGNHYYWRLVTEAKDNYIILSKTDCDVNSDTPMVGDNISLLGNRGKAERQAAIVLSAYGSDAPSYKQYRGINSYSLEGKQVTKLSPFGNELTGKLVLEAGSTGWENLTGLKDVVNKQSSDLESFASSVTKEFENIRNEMDGAIDTWFGEEEPTLDNYPANEWAENSDKDSHLGDLYYSNNGKAYRFQYTESDGYQWVAIEDSEVVKALELAQKAFDTADKKRTIFIKQPEPPYDRGDLWAGGDDAPLKRCVVSRESGSFYEDDWDLADNSQRYADAIKAQLEQDFNSAKADIDKAILDAQDASKEYTDKGKEALQASINALNESKANISNVYTKAEADGKISDAEAAAIVAAKKEADAAIIVSEEIIKAYADGIVSAEEEARIAEAQSNLAAAKKYAEEKAEEALNEAEDLVDNLEGGSENLLRNTGFFGDYVSASLTGEVVLSETSEMYSPSLQYWNTSLATAIEMTESKSGKGVRIENGGFIQQTMFHLVTDGENYVFSFRGKGGSIKVTIGQYTKTFALTNSFAPYFDKLVANGSSRIIKIEATGTCDLCEIQFEQGTIRSAWSMSPLDNQSNQAQYESLTYLTHAIENGSSEFVGGLGLVNLLFAKDMGNNIKAGMSGIHNDDHSVAFFAGGNYEQAIATALKYANDPSYQASESEIQNMAKYVVTHGGRAILNDVILRGYIYALGGMFKGTVEATDGKFRGEVEALSGTFNNVVFQSGFVGGFKVSGSGIINQIGENKYDSDAFIRLKNTKEGTEAAIGGNINVPSTGQTLLGRFSNTDEKIKQYSTLPNYCVEFSAQGAFENRAIDINGGFISGLAYKTYSIDSLDKTTIPIDAVSVVYLLTSINVVYLPSLRACDDGHVVRITAIGSNFYLKPKDCRTYNSFNEETTKTLICYDNLYYAEAGDGLAIPTTHTLELVFHRQLGKTINGVYYRGIWIASH